MTRITDLGEYTGNGQLFIDHGPDARVKAYIPTTYKDNHASNLIELSTGDILCTWFAGLSEGSSDIKIMLSRLNKGSNRWTEPMMISDDFTRSEQNPALFETPDGDVWLLHTAQLSRGKMTHQEWYQKVQRGEASGHFTMQETAEVRLRISKDKGVTFGEMIPLFTKPGAFCRHPITVLSNGDWLFPMWYSVSGGDENTPQYGGDHSVVQISSDQGKTWTEMDVPGSTRRVHMTITETTPGHCVAFFRSRSSDHIYRSYSTDYGRTWEIPKATCLPNNNASIQAIRFQSGPIALIFNNCCGSDQDGPVVWGAQRVPVTLALSLDEGLTFPYMRHIETGENFIGEQNRKYNTTYHYPSLMQSKDGIIHVSYTYHGRDCIMYQRITEAWIKGE
jgi:predicted neuraminidase